MTIQEIYKLAIEIGIKNDFRPRAQIEKQLKRVKEKYEKLSGRDKELFHKDKLFNPYGDTNIYLDNGPGKIRRILSALDVSSGDILAARYLNDQDARNPFDLILMHHPLGRSLADLADVIHMQADVLAQVGVPINIAEKIITPRVEEVYRSVNPDNMYKEIDTAKLLGISFMNVHTPADNLAASFIRKKIEKDKPEYLEDIIDSLLEIPEFREAEKMGFGPIIHTGSKESRVGKIVFTEITGGTNAGPKIYERLANAGVGTVIAMHQREESRKEADKHHLNILIGGHIPSDSLGMNLFLDELEKKGIEIVPTGGLIRVSRNKKK